MNLNKFLNLNYLKENPLCGIGTYKDTLNLETGECTRQIRKVVLTGNEEWTYYVMFGSICFFTDIATSESQLPIDAASGLCSHYIFRTVNKNLSIYFTRPSSNGNVVLFDERFNTADAFKTWLTEQYTAGTPVTIWYAVIAPTTETITVPTRLTGIVEGSLTQSTTPTPTNPVYPTANNAEGWYPFNYYIMDTATDTLPQLPSTIYPTNTYLNVELEGNTEQNGTPSPSSPVDVNGVGDESDVPTYIVNAHIDGVNIQKAFEHSELCELTAPNKPSEYFNYWKDENNNILSYNRTFTQRIAMDRNIYATYSNVEVTPQPCLEMYLYNAIKDGGNNLYWLFFGEVPDNYSVIEEGIMYTANRTAGYTQDSTVDLTTVPGFDFDAVWADSSKYRVDKYTGTGNIFTQVFNLFIGDSVNNYFYGKGYITIKNNTTQEQSTIYSDMVKGTYNNTNLRPTPTTHYNIPITCSNITYNRYLSGTESIRYIKKLVLTGGETFVRSGSGDSAFYRLILSDVAHTDSLDNSLCSHFTFKTISSSNTDIGFFILSDGSSLRIRPNDVSTSTLQTFTAWLTQQYANGTPVTVYYILSTPETSTINEPLMKIGNYTDKINTVIPTKGTTEITVNTTLQPSNISVDGFQDIEIGLKGNTVQNGTPTPDSPIMPQGTGEMTVNRFDISSVTHQTLGTDGSLVYESAMNLSGFIKVNGNYTVSWSAVRSGAYMRVSTYDDNKNFIARIVAQNTYTRSSYSNTHTGYIRINYENSYQLSDVQVNTGSTPLPYEPYGYKIPISSANTTTPVYLGEVQSTRQIRKYEFTGQENDWKVANGRFYNDNAITNYMLGISNYAYCTHFNVIEQQTSASPVHDGDICFRNGNPRVYIYNGNYETVTDFTSWLQQQYAAGTPVCVWYVLAEQTTGIVNEPLQKIGSYADSINNISITTTDRINTIDIPTTVQPSEVTVNYTGWHPVQNIHEYYSNYTIADMQTFTIAQLQTYTISELQEGEWL